MNNKDQIRKNLSNDKSLEVYVTISQKKFSCTISDKKQNEWKSWELTVCRIGVARVVANVPFQNTKGKIIFSDISNER